MSEKSKQLLKMYAAFRAFEWLNVSNENYTKFLFLPSLPYYRKTPGFANFFPK